MSIRSLTIAFIAAILSIAHMGYAQTGPSPFACNNIRDNDLRSLCNAQTGTLPFACNNIRDNDLRNLCYAETK